MYDKFDKLQVALINVFRTQLANMGSQLEERLEARIDKRIGQRLEVQTELLRDLVRAAGGHGGRLEQIERELAGLDNDINESPSEP